MGLRRAAPLVLVLAIPALTGCDQTPKERLEGRWVGVAIDAFAPEHADRVLGWAKGASFRFQGSRVTVTIPAESPRHGTYKVATLDEDQLRITFLRPHGASDEATFLFEGDDLRWMLDNGQSILMKKTE